MIVAMLVIVILILLFGAGVVKGWIANTVGCGCGGLVVSAALIWLGSYLGQDGFKYITWAVVGILGLFALAVVATNADRTFPTTTAGLPPPQAPLQAALPKPNPTSQAEASARDRVWGWFANDIARRFSPRAQERAREFYDANDVMGLDRFLREEVERLDR